MRRLLSLLLRQLEQDEPDSARPGALGRLRQAGAGEPAIPVGHAGGGRQTFGRHARRTSRRSAITSARAWTKPAMEKAGAAPLKATLDAIAGLKTLKDLPPLLAQHAPAVGAQQRDLRLRLDPGLRELRTGDRLRVGAAGWGCRIAITTPRPTPKSEETRAKYVEHVARMFELLGDAPAAAKTEAQTVMEIETALAKASLTRVELRDPYKLFHKMTRAELDADAVFRLGRLLEGERTGRHGHGQRDRAGVLRGGGDAAQGAAPRRLEDLSALARGAQSRAVSLRGVRRGGFRFLQQVPARREGTAAALEALRPAGGPGSGRSAGTGVRRQDLHRRREGTGAGHDQRDRKGDGGGPAPASLDGRRHAQEGARKAARHGEQDRLSGQVARLQLAAHRAGRFRRQRGARHRVRDPGGNWPRSASRWIAPSGT